MLSRIRVCRVSQFGSEFLFPVWFELPIWISFHFKNACRDGVISLLSPSPEPLRDRLQRAHCLTANEPDYPSDRTPEGPDPVGWHGIAATSPPSSFLESPPSPIDPVGRTPGTARKPDRVPSPGGSPGGGDFEVCPGSSKGRSGGYEWDSGQQSAFRETTDYDPGGAAPDEYNSLSSSPASDIPLKRTPKGNYEKAGSPSPRVAFSVEAPSLAESLEGSILGSVLGSGLGSPFNSPPCQDPPGSVPPWRSPSVVFIGDTPPRPYPSADPSAEFPAGPSEAPQLEGSHGSLPGALDGWAGRPAAVPQGMLETAAGDGGGGGCGGYRRSVLTPFNSPVALPVLGREQRGCEESGPRRGLFVGSAEGDPLQGVWNVLEGVVAGRKRTRWGRHTWGRS